MMNHCDVLEYLIRNDKLPNTGKRRELNR